jgi:hypothetical protein
MPHQVDEPKRPKAWRSEVCENRYGLSPTSIFLVAAECYAEMAEERREDRCEIHIAHPVDVVVVDDQGGKKVIASSICPSPAKQTEDLERCLVVLKNISDVRDKLLGKVFASRHDNVLGAKATTGYGTI